MKILLNSILFKECVENLRPNFLSKFESEKMFEMFKQLVPITDWGKVDWSKIKKHVFIGYDPERILVTLNNLIGKGYDKSVYVVWSTAGIPVIQTDLNSIINHFDDVVCVAFETFIFNPTIGYVIEIKGGDEATVGIVPEDRVNRANTWYNCLTLLGDTIKILSRDHRYKKLRNRFGFGKDSVAWNLIDEKTTVISKDNIVPSLQTLLKRPLEHESVYILWDDVSLPVIETSLENFIANINVIKTMKSKVWIFNESKTYILEIANNDITIGLPPKRHQM